MTSTVAIVIPVYATPENHRLDYLDRTLRSVRKQTHRDLVGVVVDDGSTVDVKALVEDQKYDKLRYVRREREPTDLKTASNAANLGIDLCIDTSGEVFTPTEADDLVAITYLDSDDMLTPRAVEKRLAALSEDNAFVHTDMIGVYANNRLTRVTTWKNRDRDFKHNHQGFPFHTVTWTVEFARMQREYAVDTYGQQGIFDARLSHGEDRDMSLTLFEVAGMTAVHMAYIPQVTYVYTRHPNSVTSDPVPAKYLKEQHDLIYSKHFPEGDSELKRIQFLQRLIGDLPWSLGAPLPEEVKRYLRPIRDHIKWRRTKKNMTSEELEGLESILAVVP